MGVKEHPQTVFCQDETCPSNQNGLCVNKGGQLDHDTDGLCISGGDRIVDAPTPTATAFGNSTAIEVNVPSPLDDIPTENKNQGLLFPNGTSPRRIGRD